MKKNPRGSDHSSAKGSGFSVERSAVFLTHHPFGVWFCVACLILAPVYAWFLVQSDWLDKPPKPIGDGLCYESIGFSLYSGNGFFEDYHSPEWRALYQDDPDYADILQRSEQRVVPATGRPPVLPFMIAMVYGAADRTPGAFAVVRILLAGCLVVSGGLAAGLTALLLYRRTGRFLASALGAGMTIALAASQQTLKEYTTDFLTEPIALLWTQLLITLVVLRLTSGRVGLSWAIPIGLCMGLMVLTRSMFVMWIPGLLGLMYLVEQGGNRQRFRFVAMVGLVCTLTCLPWWVHNCVVLGRFMPLGTQGAVATLGGYSDEAYRDMGNWSYQPELDLRESMKEGLAALKNDTEREVAVAEAASLELKKWIAGNFEKLPSLAIMRAVTHWNPYSGKSAIWKVLIVLGIVWVIRNETSLRWWLIGLPILSTVVVMGLYETGGRFLVPLYAHLFFLAGLSVGLFWRTNWRSSQG